MGFPDVKNARKNHVGMEVVIVHPKIVGGFPGLGDDVELEGMNGLRGPYEMNVGSRARYSGSFPSTMRESSRARAYA
jgi:hypothetical protein